MESSNEDSSASFSSCVAGSNAPSESKGDGENTLGESEKHTSTPVSDMEWTPELEILLFKQLRHHRPIGYAKHLQMMLILEKFSAHIGKPVSAKYLWDRIETYYNISVLDESERQDEAPTTGDFELDHTQTFTELKSKPFPRAAESDSDLDQPLAACIPSQHSAKESDAQSLSTDALSLSNMGESSRASTPVPSFSVKSETVNSSSSQHRRQTRNKRSAAPSTLATSQDDSNNDGKHFKQAGTPLGTPSSTMNAPISVMTGNSARSNRKRNSKN